MNLLTLALVFTLGAFQDSGTEFFEDFRDKKIDNLKVTPSYPDASQLMKSEPEGLRLTLPAGPTKHKEIGVIPPLNAQGDFEITAGYEIINVDPHNAGDGITFEIYLITGGPANKALAFYRYLRPDGSGRYFFYGIITNAQGKRQGIGNFNNTPIPFQGVKTGQMRVKRVGSEAVLSVAEPPGAEFRDLFHIPLNNEDVKRFRVGINSHGASSFIDVRLLDLRIKGNLVSTDPKPLRDSNPPADLNTLKATQIANPSRKTWVWLLIGLFLSLLIGGLLVWWLKRERSAMVLSPPKNVLTESLPEPAQEIISEAYPDPISFLCSGCSKELKAKAELAGKKIKCPQCGQAVQVP